MPIDFAKLEADLGPDPRWTPVPVVSEIPVTDAEPFSSLWPEDEQVSRGLVVLKELPPIVDSVEFSATEIERPPELIAGMVHKGTKISVGGSSKAFKTWVQLDIGTSVAYGLPWMGLETVRGRVLFANFEIQPVFFQERLRKIIKTRGIAECAGNLDVWNLRGYSATYRLVIPRIIERIKAVGYSLVILDPIYKLYGDTDENSAGQVAQLLNELERVCVETGAAVLFGAHYSKGNQAAKESIDRISGSGVFARDPDTIIGFTKHEDEGSFVVEPTLRNLPPIPPFVVTWNYPLMERNDDLDPTKLKQVGGREKVHSADDLLTLLNDGPLHVKKWEENALKIHGISRSAFFKLKSELKSRDLVMYSRLNDNWLKLEKKPDA